MNDKPHDDLAAAFTATSDAHAASRRLAPLIIDAYERLDKKQLQKVLLLEWRCLSNGCLLIHVWQSPMGPLYWIPHYKVSKKRNAERSVASARAKNTLNGDNIWKPRAGSLWELREWGESLAVSLQCDHLEDRAFSAAALLAAASPTPGQPTRARISGR